MIKQILLGLSLALLLGTFSPSEAQENMSPFFTDGEYCFGEQDLRKVNALWHLVGAQWREALAHKENERLRQPINGRQRESKRNGTTYYLVFPGECMYVPEGITSTMPLEREKEEAPPTTTDQHNAKGDMPTSSGAGSNFWLLILAGLSFLLALYLAKRRSPSGFQDGTYVDPATAGPPMLDGGLEYTEPEDRAEVGTACLQDLASRVFVPGARPQEFRVIGELVRGTLNGEGMVEYANGETQSHVFRETLAFQALMEHVPTGQRRIMHALWACLNGCYNEMVTGNDFIFTPMMDQSRQPLSVVTILTPDRQLITECTPAKENRASWDTDFFREEVERNHHQRQHNRIFTSFLRPTNGPANKRTSDKMSEVA